MTVLVTQKPHHSIPGGKIRPTGSWRNLKTHYLNVLNDPWYKLIAEIQNLITAHTAGFYEKRGIKTLHLPVTTGSISSPMGLGSDSTAVKINLQGAETHLADSMQFMLEYGCRIYDKGCYYIMPSFRGEPVDERHLCQFYHSEAEIPGNLSDVIRLVEDYIRYLCQKLLEDFRMEIYSSTGDNSHIEKFSDPATKIESLPLEDALRLLGNRGRAGSSESYFITHPSGFKVLTKAGEKELISMFGGFVWITHFDHLSVPFYQSFDRENRTKAVNADLLLGIGEVVGSGQRHASGTQVVEALRLHNVDGAQYEWYSTMKSRFPIQTSGFGMGIERFILWLLKHDDIRDCQILPRFNGVNVIP